MEIIQVHCFNEYSKYEKSEVYNDMWNITIVMGDTSEKFERLKNL